MMEGSHLLLFIPQPARVVERFETAAAMTALTMLTAQANLCVRSYPDMLIEQTCLTFREVEKEKSVLQVAAPRMTQTARICACFPWKHGFVIETGDVAPASIIYMIHASI
jgi:hypothetical protein